MDMAGKFGWFLFKPSETAFSEAEVPKEQPDGDEPKSPSQALRAAKFVWFTKKGGKPEEFPTWWRKWCNKQRQETIDAINELG